jgi:hypothetical protein
VQSTKCLWLSGLSPQTRLGDIEAELLRILRSSRMDRRRIEVRYNPKECNFALILFDSLREAEMCRNELRGRQFPNTQERVKCDYYEPRKFKFYPGFSAKEQQRDKDDKIVGANNNDSGSERSSARLAKRKQSRSRSRSGSRSRTPNGRGADHGDTSDYEQDSM